MNSPSPIVLAVQQFMATQQSSMPKEGLGGLSFKDLISQIMAGSFANVNKEYSEELDALVNADTEEAQAIAYFADIIPYFSSNTQLVTLTENQSMDLDERLSGLFDKLKGYLERLQSISMENHHKPSAAYEFSIRPSDNTQIGQMQTGEQESIIANISSTLAEIQVILESNLVYSNVSANDIAVQHTMVSSQIMDNSQSMSQVLETIKEIRTIIKNVFQKPKPDMHNSSDETLASEQKQMNNLQTGQPTVLQDESDMSLTYLKEKVNEVLNSFDDIQKKISKGNQNIKELFEVHPGKANKILSLFKDQNAAANVTEQKEPKSLNTEKREPETLNKEKRFQINTKAETQKSSEVSGKTLKDFDFQVQESHDKVSTMMKHQQSKEGISFNSGSGANSIPVIKNADLLQRELIKHFQQIGDKERSTLTVQLQPKELGKMKIELELKEGIVNGKIFVESETAKQALQQHLQTMKDQIKNQGITLESLEVNISNESFQEFRQQEEQIIYRPRKWEINSLYEADNPEVITVNNNSSTVNRLNILA